MSPVHTTKKRKTSSDEPFSWALMSGIVVSDKPTYSSPKTEYAVSGSTRGNGDRKEQTMKSTKVRQPSSGVVYSGRKKTQAKSAAMPQRTAMRGVLAPDASASTRNSQAAKAATAAAVSVINQNGALKTRSNTRGTRMTAVRTRFIVRKR